MTEAIEVDTPDATIEVQEKTVGQRRDDLVEARRARLLEDDVSEVSEITESSEVEADADTDEVEVDAPEIDESDNGESPEDVLSQVDQIDVDSLTEDDIYAIAQAKGIDLEPKGNSAWAKQRRKIKELEDALNTERAAKEEALAVRTTTDSESELKQTEANLKHWQRKLMLEGETQYDEASGRDVKGVMHDGKFYPADQVIQFLDQEEAKLPDLRKRVQEAEKARGKLGNLDEVIDGVREKFNLQGEALDAYDALLSNPKFEIVKNVVPDFGVEMVELFGMAALQKAGPKKKKVTIKRKAPKESKEAISPKGSSSYPDSSGKSAQRKRLERIASDPKLPISQRRKARLDLQHLKYI